MTVFRNLGVSEIILTLAIVLLLFGAKRIPEIARSLGKSLPTPSGTPMMSASGCGDPRPVIKTSLSRSRFPPCMDTMVG